MSDYDRTQQNDPRYQRRDEAMDTGTGPDEVEIYDRPDTMTSGGTTGMGLGIGLVVLLVVAVLVVLLILFLF